MEQILTKQRYKLYLKLGMLQALRAYKLRHEDGACISRSGSKREVPTWDEKDVLRRT